YPIPLVLPPLGSYLLVQTLLDPRCTQLPPSLSLCRASPAVLNVDHVFLRQATPESSRNSSLKAQTQYVLITGKGGGLPQPAVNASYGPLSVDAPISPDLLLSGRRILPVILVRKVRSSSPVVKILFHMPAENDVTADRAHCVTAYAFWETREVRGACLVLPGGFCVAQLRPEPAWFSSASRSGSASKEAGKTEGIKGLQGNLVEVYFQSRRDRTGQCNPQDSLQRVGVGKGRGSGGSGTPMRRIGSVSLLRTQSGNPTYFRVRLGGAVVIQTSSKPLKDTDIATFYVFLPSTSTLETFTLRATVKAGLAFSVARPSDSALWDIAVEPGRGATPNTVSTCAPPLALTCLNLFYFKTPSLNRGLLEVLQLDFVPRDVSELAESQMISWRLELPGNVKEVGIMRIYTTQRDYVGLAPLVMNTDILNTAVLTGETVSVPVKTLAVEADGSVTDVTNYTSCRSTEEDVVKVSERCDYVYVNGKETTGRSRVMLNFTYGFLSAQLEMSVWVPRLPLLIDVADPELSQIKGWRVPVITGSRSEEEEEMRKGRGCMLQYQHSTLRVLTPFIARADDEAPPDPLTGDATAEYFLGPDWQVDVTKLVRSSLKVADPDVARVQDGAVLQGRAVGATTVQVLSPVTSSVLAERSIRVVDDKVSVTQLGVHLVSGLSLSLQLSPGSSGAIVATATTRETITFFLSHFQEAVVSCWVQFSDGTVVPLELFDRTTYSLTVSTPDEGVATVRRTPLSTFLVAQGEGRGQGALVRVEMRICEECQKSKRKSKLAVGTGLVRVNFRSSGRVVAGERGGNKVGADGGKDFDGGASELVGGPRTTQPSESGDDLVATFRAMSDVEIGTYAVVGVTCVAILAVLLKCASNKLCFRGKKTPIQAGPSPAGDPKDHKHDWVWLESNSEGTSAPGAPAQVSTLKRECTLPTVSAPAAPERTATLGRSRNSSQQQHFQGAAMSPMASRSATLLARPQHSEPLHSPTSKRNQVQFTTFTTLDIKHLAALKKNGVDLNWAHQQTLQHQTPAKPQSPLPDMPWPVVKPLAEPQ
uniref:Uncharacterized protein n=1 Tax=Gasterosteus aculeatus aculeatus TaxID=481459 RepID=G3Q063_GASAC